MNKKLRLVLPTILVILMIAFSSAFACTYLMKRIKRQQFIDSVGSIYLSIESNLALNFSPKGGEREQKLYKYEMETITADRASNMDYNDEYFDYAVVLYDYATNKTVISDPRIVINEDLTIHLTDYLSKEEIISYATDFRRSIYNKGGLLKVYMNSDDIPVTIETTGLPPFTQIKLIEHGVTEKWDLYQSYFPKRIVEKEVWIERFTSWMNNETLQNELQEAKERIKYNEGRDDISDTLIVYQRVLYDKFFENGNRKSEPYCNIIVIGTYHPWKAAMRDLKAVYLLIVILTVLISFLLSKNILDSYQKQSDLEETRRSFITAMAHDLKTPLTVIKGYTENLMDSNDEEKKSDYLRKINSKTDEINDMVSEMLDISKIDASGFEIKRKELMLNDILKKTIERYRETAYERCLSFSLKEEKSFSIVGDEDLLEKLFSNLIDNAISYTRNGSEIVISIDENKINIFNEADPIEEEKLKNIFEFKSGTNGHHGFGLYFAKKVADIHNLKLTINNQENGVNTLLTK
ncbi:MAG: HAMP domain-containing histidine kinase [Erysipelotrichaceae bacterium]|nr:HAMP domain-containing histidine kinase [Erysipelotrichaceae bacterium]